MVKKKKSPKTLKMFGLKFDYEDYEQRMMPDGAYQIDKLYQKMGLDTLKPTIKTKTKFWDCDKIYPTTEEDFIAKYFKKKKPKDLEGIWSQSTPFGIICYGLVKEDKNYHNYMIQNKMKMVQASGSFFKDIFNPPEADYEITSGTKFGIFTYDKKKQGSVSGNKFLKFKGIGTIINTMSGNNFYPINFEVEYDVTHVNERELRSESKDAKFLEKNHGISRSAFKYWPHAKPSIEDDNTNSEWERTPSPDSEGYIDYINKKNRIKSKIKSEETPKDEKKAGSVGSGFFVSDKGHIVTNFHVIKNSNSIKFIYNDDEVDAKLIASDQQLDLALLKSKIENKSYIKFSNKSPQKAQNILVAGFPFGKAISDDLKITGGIINSLKGGGNDSTRFQLDATINPGNSGGPIVDKVNGSLVGVAVTKLNKDVMKAAFGAESENTNYGIKASQVRDFLEANNLKVSVKKGKFKVSELESSTVFIHCK